MTSDSPLLQRILQNCPDVSYGAVKRLFRLAVMFALFALLILGGTVFVIVTH